MEYKLLLSKYNDGKSTKQEKAVDKMNKELKERIKKLESTLDENTSRDTIKFK